MIFSDKQYKQLKNMVRHKHARLKKRRRASPLTKIDPPLLAGTDPHLT